MPYRKRNMKKRPFRKRTKKVTKKRLLVPRNLRPKTYIFKRDIEYVLNFNTTAPEGWTLEGNGAYTNLGWSLGSLGNITDFQNLFKQYKIMAARSKFYFSNTVSGSHGNEMSNSQLILRLAPNQAGVTPALTIPYFQQLQKKQYRTAYNGGRPIDIYMPLKIQSEIQSSTYTAPAMVSPRWIDTSVTNVVHSGINIRLDRVDGQGFTSGFSNGLTARLITTLYLTMRGVQ